MLHQPKFWQMLLKTIVYSVCINLQADLFGVASSFARMCTSRLKVKQKAKIVNCRWAGSFGKLLVCFAAKTSVNNMTIQPLLKNLLTRATLV